jgi:hypothetical protein
MSVYDSFAHPQFFSNAVPEDARVANLTLSSTDQESAR